MQGRYFTLSRSMARVTAYHGACAVCGTRTLAGQAVMARQRADQPSNPLCDNCTLPQGWAYKADRVGSGALTWDEATGGVAAAPQVAQQASQAAPTATELEATAAKLLKDVTDGFMSAVPDLVRSTMIDATRTVEIKVPKMPVIKVDTAHRLLPDIVMALIAGVHPMIVGPAGSGKTTLCQQAAKIIGKPFYMANSVAGKHELLGFRDATGKAVHTDFYKAFKNGGLFLLDEMDNCNPSALVALNAAVANGICEFAGELITAHKTFQMIGAANTFGRGADAQYVGRTKLDAATLDRFCTFVQDYDEDLEHTLAGNKDWTNYVQSVRRIVFAERIAHVVSPRASISGAKLLAAGMDRAKVAECCIWKGLDATHRARIEAKLGAVL